jgi:hypothetical protein
VRAAEHPEELENDPDNQLPFYAMYLLAVWREPQAHELLLNFLRLSGESTIELSGDIVPQDMPWMLAQTCAGDTSQLEALATDRTVNEWARGAAVNALTCLARIGAQSIESLGAQFRRIISSARQSSDKSLDQIPLGDLVCGVLDLQLVDLRDEVLALYDEGRIYEDMVGREEVVQELGNGLPKAAEPVVTDVTEAISWWGCFRGEDDVWDEEQDELDELADLDDAVEFDELDEPTLKDYGPGNAIKPPLNPGIDYDLRPQPYRAPPKIGRNDPCPCGSGKKYKKCCGA